MKLCSGIRINAEVEEEILRSLESAQMMHVSHSFLERPLC